MRLNLRQIEAFRAAFQTGSMTAAGDLMGITQPAISRLIRDLEAEIAIRLFDRTGGRITPTPDAVALFREVERSFHGLDRISRAAAELRGRREGALRIAASVAPSFFAEDRRVARGTGPRRPAAMRYRGGGRSGRSTGGPCRSAAGS